MPDAKFTFREKCGRQQVKIPPAQEEILDKQVRFRTQHSPAVYAQIETHSLGDPIRLLVLADGSLVYTTTFRAFNHAQTIITYLMAGNAEGLLDRIHAPTLVNLARQIEKSLLVQAEMEFA